MTVAGGMAADYQSLAPPTSVIAGDTHRKSMRTASALSRLVYHSDQYRPPAIRGNMGDSSTSKLSLVCFRCVVSLRCCNFSNFWHDVQIRAHGFRGLINTCQPTPRKRRRRCKLATISADQRIFTGTFTIVVAYFTSSTRYSQ